MISKRQSAASSIRPHRDLYREGIETSKTKRADHPSRIHGRILPLVQLPAPSLFFIIIIKIHENRRRRAAFFISSIYTYSQLLVLVMFCSRQKLSSHHCLHSCETNDNHHFCSLLSAKNHWVLEETRDLLIVVTVTPVVSFCLQIDLDV